MSGRLTPSTLRRGLQVLFAAQCLLIGWQFVRFCQWASGASPVAAARPAVVEAFLPISALLGLKQLLFTGQYDPVHPAGLSILLAVLLTAFLARKGFCAFVCPVGFISNGLAWLGRRAGLRVRPWPWLSAVLGSLKYVLLGFFLVVTFGLMDVSATAEFLHSSYNLTADARMLLFFRHPSAAALGVFGLLAVAGMLVPNAWCRWLCPYGALLGLLAWAGPMAIRRDEQRCNGCGRCEKVCPTGVAVLHATRGPSCQGCTRCLEVCPKDALDVTVAGRHAPWWLPAAGAAGLLVVLCVLAQVLGLWNSTVPMAMLRGLYAAALAG